MLESVHFRGYRSLRDVRLRLGEVTVVTGQNGGGKSNVYRALAMIQRLAEGHFAETIAAGGRQCQVGYGREGGARTKRSG